MVVVDSFAQTINPSSCLAATHATLVFILATFHPYSSDLTRFKELVVLQPSTIIQERIIIKATQASFIIMASLEPFITTVRVAIIIVIMVVI